VVTAQELTKAHAERCRERRQLSLVDGLAGLEAPDRPYVDAGSTCELVDAKAALDAKSEYARR
jgi:hypothetical protein